MVRKTFIIDTNILLHDPDAIIKFHNNDVVIPLAVLEELDGMKRFSDELGKNARHVLRYIDGLKNAHPGQLAQGVSIENDILVKVQMDTKFADREAFPFSLDRSAHKIVFSAFKLKEQGVPVSLISKDFIVRVKAEAVGIESQDYINLRFSYENIYKGYRKLDMSKKNLDLFYKDGVLPIDLPDLYPNEYCLISSKEQSSAVCKYNSQNKQLEPLLKLPRDIWGVHPLNIEQKCALDLLLRDDIKLVTLMGPAGTGKTLLALAVGLKKIFDDGNHKKILVSRPIVPLGKDIGYLPGSKEEKLYHWMQPIYDNLEFLCESTGSANSAETQKWIMESKKIEMEAVTYIRGRTLPNMYIIIDEAQNLTPHEVKTIISRAGQGTKVVLTGDPTQIDNPYLDKDSNALTYTVGRFKEHPIYGHIFLDRTERSELAALATEML
ncbi:PhoH-like protein [Candidatus Rhabdochlamydia oedothoracis]|uniref:PhoH-like protein n=1 Tax=Candidatus Rhabdochlamydia oedothoracis TaxID=2720720 RepID=A0ABX8UZV1_9BACT|nr:MULTISPECIES: PhoH family protein [Rhabdochlamydia]KAG6559156.1 PhoH-like protein [Candidatus Rhabdochlamydia sp. W815]QYF48494.1 PhoH-like protein [Candidatus Rhabdochlamydia oedothoracis]